MAEKGREDIPEGITWTKVSGKHELAFTGKAPKEGCTEKWGPM